PSLRYLSEMCTKRAEALEQDAAIERQRARRYLEAAEARAEEKLAGKRFAGNARCSHDGLRSHGTFHRGDARQRAALERSKPDAASAAPGPPCGVVELRSTHLRARILARWRPCTSGLSRAATITSWRGSCLGVGSQRLGVS